MRIIFSNVVKNAGGPALFLDRDGVINRRRPDDYVLDWSQFIFQPGIPEALRRLSALGLPMIIISNQSAVGKGLLKPDTLEEITTQLHITLRAEGAILAAAYYCPHKADENCSCRKPKPGLLYKAGEDFCVDLTRSVFVGDSDTDVQAARAAGCTPVLFGNGLSASFSSEWTAHLPTALTAAELFDVVAKCLQAENKPVPVETFDNDMG